MARNLFYQAVLSVLEITLDEELKLERFINNFNRMFGKEIMHNVVGSITGAVKFYSLTKTSMKLEGLDKHQGLIDSYKKFTKLVRNMLKIMTAKKKINDACNKKIKTLNTKLTAKKRLGVNKKLGVNRKLRVDKNLRANKKLRGNNTPTYSAQAEREKAAASERALPIDGASVVSEAQP